VIGTAYGWALGEAGADVVHLVRPGRKARYASGIDLDLLDLRPGHGRTRAAYYRPNVVEEVESGDRFDLAMLPVKHYQLAKGLRDLAPKLPATDFLLFAANWDGPQAVDEILPRTRYAWGTRRPPAGTAARRSSSI
jgi:2-dehydropantoate 2-reductase